MRTIRGPIYTLQPYERGIQETLGKYNQFVMPGFGFQIPIVHIIRVRDIREHTMDIDPQPVITKDNVEITVDGVMWVRPAADEETRSRRPRAPDPFFAPLFLSFRAFFIQSLG